MMRNTMMMTAGAAALLALVAGTVRGAEPVDAKGWYSAVPEGQCTSRNCVCLTFEPIVSGQPLLDTARAAATIQKDVTTVNIWLTHISGTALCFQNRQSTEPANALPHLLLNVNLSREGDVGVPRNVLVRSIVAGTPAKLVKVFIEPIP